MACRRTAIALLEFLEERGDAIARDTRPGIGYRDHEPVPSR